MKLIQMLRLTLVIKCHWMVLYRLTQLFYALEFMVVTQTHKHVDLFCMKSNLNITLNLNLEFLSL